MQVRRAIAARQSRRAFAARPVERDKLERLLEAARWAPSSGNKQPWRLIVVGRDAPSRAGVEAALDPGNAWAQAAPVLLVIAARPADGSRAESRAYHHHDCGLALMSLLLRATDLGLLAHPMAGWREAPLQAAVGLPPEYAPISVTAIGYPGRAADLDPVTRAKDERPRTRLPLEQVAFDGHFGVGFAATLPTAPAKVFAVEIPLRFADLDAMGHVNNAVTLTLFETGRLKFFADVLGARRPDEIDLILAQADCRYVRPIQLSDVVHVRMFVTDVGTSAFAFQAELFDPRDGRVFAQAETVQVQYDYAAGRPLPLRPELLAQIRDYIGG
ncbi:MAG TPA: nitroreductase family protein [Polyangia bacterium]|jgi:YbgC/YbaW family acyl-CoA thioester hydrolase